MFINIKLEKRIIQKWVFRRNYICFVTMETGSASHDSNSANGQCPTSNYVFLCYLWCATNSISSFEVSHWI